MKAHTGPVVWLLAACSSIGCGNTNLGEISEESDQSTKHATGLTASALTLQVDTSKCLDVRAASTVNGTPAQLYDCNGTAAQSWTYNGGTLQVLGSKCLDVTGGSTANGTLVQLWDCSAGNVNQQWTLSGSQLQWTGTSKCVDLPGGTRTNGTQLQLWDCYNNDNQRWNNRFGGTTGPTPKPTGALDVAPYFFSWGYYGAYKISSLVDAKNRAGMTSATFAFEISGGGCNASADLDDHLSDAKAFIAAGGRLIISFGGAAGPFLEGTCTSASAIASAIEGVMNRSGSYNLDFDVEGSALSDAGANSRRIQALQTLQTKYANLYVSYTLPVDARGGLPAEAVTLLRNNVQAGIKISRVNIMAMDYGYSLPGKSSGDLAISASEATLGQLRSLYPGVSDGTLYKTIGITPMIGRNDDGYYFQVNDAKQVAQYAKSKGIGLLAFWAMQRDQTGTGSYNDYSLAQSVNFEFLQALQTAQH